MKKFILFFLIGVFHLQISFAQNPLVKQWDKSFGGTDIDLLWSFIQTTDGGYALGGISLSGISGDKTQPLTGVNDIDMWMVRLDSLGNKLWDKDFGGFQEDYLSFVRQTPDHGFIIGGSTRSGIGGNKSQPNWDTTESTNDFWILKLDSAGNQQWDKTYGGADQELLLDLELTSDGGFILGGESASGISGNKTEPQRDTVEFYFDWWIVKTDSVGNIKWDKSFGGPDNDCLFSLQQTFDGGFIFGGLSESGIGGDKSQPLVGINDVDFWMVRTDSVGNKLWDRDFGGSQGDVFGTLNVTNDGGFITGGKSFSGISGNKSQPLCGIGQTSDFWLLKVDSSGNKQWDKDFGGSDSEYKFGNTALTSDGGFLLSGSSFSDSSCVKSQNNLGPRQIWFIKTDSAGALVWEKTALSNGLDYAGFVIQTSDGGIALATSTTSGIAGDKSQNNQDTSNITTDYWLIKYADTTVHLPQAIIQVSDTNFCGKQSIDFFDHSTNNPTSWLWLFPGGSPSSSTLQNPTGIFYNSYGTFDVTLISCNASGCDTLYLPNFIHELQNPPVPVVTWIADTLYSTQAYSYQWYFNSTAIPGATNQYYVFQQPGNYFVIVTDSNGCATSSNAIYTDIDEIANDNSSIYVIPNPNDGNFILYGTQVNSILEIYDVAGRIIFEDKIKSSKENLQLKANDGIYFLVITNHDKIIRKKLVMKN